MSRALLAIAVAAAALTLSGCGKKPSFVDAPQGAAADRFPQPYPNPTTDPKPNVSNLGQPAPGIRFP